MVTIDSAKLVAIGPTVPLIEIIAGQLTRLILDGQYKPGDRLPAELELAKRFGVSRGTIREAVKALGLVGLVRSQRGKGTVIAERSEFLVRPISLAFKSQTDLEAIVEARRVIECELAALAAERATLTEVQHMESCLDMIKNHADAGITVKLDLEFHFAIAHAARSPLLCQFLTLIRNLLEVWFLLRPEDPELASQGDELHRQVFVAIRDRKPDEARRVMNQLVEMSAKVLRAAGPAQGPNHTVNST